MSKVSNILLHCSVTRDDEYYYVRVQNHTKTLEETERVLRELLQDLQTVYLEVLREKI